MDDPEPMYRQIEAQLRDLIVSGALPAGTKLPSVRALARDLSVSVITTRRAYQDLEGAGFIRTRQGMGTAVASLDAAAKERYRRGAIFGAFKAAASAGKRAGYTGEELRELAEGAIAEVEDEGRQAE
jgi:GntR family transcriptional regulator